MRITPIVFFISILLAACAAPVTLPPPPTPQVLEIGLTPATRTWAPAIRACANTIPELRLLVEEYPASNLEVDNGISIRLGIPNLQTPYFAAQIGKEQILIVVHPDNPLLELTSDALRQIFTGQVTTWDKFVASYPEPIQVWSYPTHDELHQIFTTALWHTNPPSILAYLAPDPAAMLEAISDNPGAVGYLPSSWLESSSLSLVSIEAQLQEALRQPVLLLSAQEPQGLARNLISCLQAAQN